MLSPYFTPLLMVGILLLFLGAIVFGAVWSKRMELRKLELEVRLAELTKKGSDGDG